MADQDSGIMDESVVRSAMAEFDTVHLCKLSALIFDRWNWDTGSEIDKRWMEIADEILQTRGVNLNMSQSNPNSGPMITCDPNGPQELIIKADKLTLEDPVGGTRSVLFESFAGVELGFELKKAIVKFMDDELQNKNTLSMSGKYLKDIIAEAAADAVREKLY
jgi:hypothetical protein